MGISKTEQGTWRCRWTDFAGVRHAKVFKTKAAATEHMAKITLSPLSIVAKPSTMTVETWFSQWLDSSRHFAPKTKLIHRDAAKRFMPRLGDVPLKNVTAYHVDQVLNELTARGLSASTVRATYSTLRSMFTAAVDRRLIVGNPCVSVKQPRIVKTDVDVLTVDEVDRLANAINPRLKLWVYVAAIGGLRWSETVGLRRSDFAGNRISVTSQLLRQDGMWVRSPLKTRASQRTVSMPQFVDVDTHFDRWVGPSDDDLVFTGVKGRPLGRNFWATYWTPALSKAGIERHVRIHDLRHTAASLGILAGLHPKQLQARLGHSNIAITMDRYGHLMDTGDDLAADVLDRMWQQSV